MHIPSPSGTASLALLLSASLFYFAQAASILPRLIVILEGTTSATSPMAILLACLKPLGSKVLTESNLRFEQERYGFYLRYTYLPQVIVMASTVPDVQTATKCAADAKVPIAPRSGGHSFEGYGIGGQDGSMVIDLTGFNKVAISASGVAKVGAGVRLGPLYLELFKQGGWTLNAGTCPSVGVGGHTLGGGFGFLSGKYGLLIDSVLEMEFVNAKGEVLTASADSNRDLFFALRGAGSGSYGVVTQFTYQAFKSLPLVTSFTYNWPLEDCKGGLRAYNVFQTTLQTEAARDIGVGLKVRPDGLQLCGTYQGNKDKLEFIVQPFLNMLPPPEMVDVRESRQIDAHLRFSSIDGHDIEALALMSENKPKGSRYAKGKSLVYSSLLRDSTLELMGKWAAKKPEGSTGNHIYANIWTGAIRDVEKNATAFIHRDALMVFEFVVEWNHDPNAKAGIPECVGCLKWLNDMYAEFLEDFKSHYGPVRGYQNYIDRDIPNWQDAYYGDVLPKLKRIKKAVDPGDTFRFPQSIPLP
ncbi:hypothetical protein EMPS_11372 [Entomortierella parvispora]|uniref:FAD-binding PCMH-type domain-containing protein n=1 Tax=Entomortierella parvispora TaxID=205924 RepID=A0A9P3M262_9FUNG|nr:hypothetical protein EMPS_11372 [Entomortierella parvispora]